VLGVHLFNDAANQAVIELLQSLFATLDRRNKTRAFVVRYHNGQQLAYVYFEDEAARRSVVNLQKSSRGD